MIYVIRQGQTDWNLFHRFNGTTETFLNQTGIDQARKQAEDLKGVSFDFCFCSPQKRALQTCEILCPDKIQIDHKLAEIDCGVFEGQEETSETMKAFFKASLRGEQNTENFHTFIQRNCSFCDQLSKYKNCNILVVTHAANARVINYYFNGKPADYDFMKPIGQNGVILTYEN